MEWSVVETDLAGGRGATAVGLHGPSLLLLRGSASVIAPQATAPDPGGSGEQAGDAQQQAAPQGRGGRKGREEREGETGRRRGRRTQTDSGLSEEQVDARRAAAPAAATYIQTTSKQPNNTQKAQSDPATKAQASAERPTCPATPHRLRKPIAIRPHREDTSERREADVPSHASVMQSESTGKKQASAERPTSPATPAPRGIMQVDPTGKTQASAERLTFPATPHRAREHN